MNVCCIYCQLMARAFDWESERVTKIPIPTAEIVAIRNGRLKSSFKVSNGREGVTGEKNMSRPELSTRDVDSSKVAAVTIESMRCSCRRRPISATKVVTRSQPHLSVIGYDVERVDGNQRRVGDEAQHFLRGRLLTNRPPGVQQAALDGKQLAALKGHQYLKEVRGATQTLVESN